MTDALARWTSSLWQASDDVSEQPRSLTCYIDGHRKPVYTDTLIPRGLVGRLSAVLGCRALVLLHDEQGHPLLVTTHRGDQHLTIGLPLITARYEQTVAKAQVNRIIVDREGMAAEFFASLQAAGRTVVSVLRTDQYRDLASFSQVGAFVPLSTTAQGQIVREVAPAHIALPLPDHPGEVLPLRVALISDLRRLVPVQPDQPDAELPHRWDADRERTDPRWWEAGWQATAAPATPLTPKLIPIATTADMCDARELAQTYIHRWPAQENVIKDYLLPLGLDTNHGFAKTEVVNSEMAKRRSALQKRLAKLRHWAESASTRSHQAGKRHDRLRVQIKSRADKLYRELGLHQTTLEMQGIADHLLRREMKERKAVIDAELEVLKELNGAYGSLSKQESIKNGSVSSTVHTRALMCHYMKYEKYVQKQRRRAMDLGLKEKVALVLAASKGLGRASAAALAAEGADLAIGARNRDALEKTAQELTVDSGGHVLAVPTDVTKEEEIAAIVAATVREYGHIDILVNNAGGPPSGTFETIGDQQWQAAFELNLLSAVRLIRRVLPHMRPRGSGRIINIVSTSVKEPIEGLLLSNATRMAVIGLAKTLSIELAPENITVNNVCPGRFLTDRLRLGHTVMEKKAQGMSEAEALGNMAQGIPMGRLGRPEELGAIVAFLASKQAGYITGTTIQVDGGLVRAVF